jgi:parvulin-like peptidyl-prolyl isomerase
MMPRIVLVAALCGAAACSDKSALARVGNTRLRTADLDAWMAARRGVSQRQALDELVERQLLAEEAAKEDLAADPVVAARLHAAEREVLAQALLDRKLDASEAGLRKEYAARRSEVQRRQVHVAQIVIRLGQGAARDDARARAQQLYGKALRGDSFEALAREASDDRASAARGGELPVLREGDVDPAFFEAAAKLHKGEISAPVETPFALHVIKALEEPAVVVPPFEEARDHLAARVRSEAEARLIAGLRGSIPVEVHESRLPSVAVAHK